MAEGQYEPTGQRHALASPQQVAASAGPRMAAPVCAIIVAGGTGSRFGNPGGKQLVMVDGRPLVSWCIAAFDRAELVGHIVVVCPQERRSEMGRDAVEPFGYATPVTYADAGSTRQDSTRAGLMRCRRAFPTWPCMTGPGRLSSPRPSTARLGSSWPMLKSTVWCADNPLSIRSSASSPMAASSTPRRAASFGRCKRRRFYGRGASVCV